MTIKAIETVYKGYRFRSRLEARWAVFFDALGVKWEYEQQGYEIKSLCGNHKWLYLPDFYLPDLGAHAEVKGSLDQMTDDYLRMIGYAVDYGGCLPGMADSSGTTAGLIFLGPLPRYDLRNAGIPVHLILQHSKGGWCNEGFFTGRTPPFYVNNYGTSFFDALTGDSPSVIREALARVTFAGDWLCLNRRCEPEVTAAYDSARRARFEHGEKPRFVSPAPAPVLAHAPAALPPPQAPPPVFQPEAGCPYEIGQLVEHETYGAGSVVAVVGYGPMRTVKIKFDNHGERSFRTRIVKLNILF
jgi:hypothetical protein